MAIDDQTKQASQRRADYIKVEFSSLASFDFDPERNNFSDIPPAVLQLDGKRVSITGKMASIDEDIDTLTEKFMLLPRDFQNDHPRLPQFMLICATNASGRFRVGSGLFEIGGMFHVALLRYEGEIYALYSMDADYCKKVSD